MNWADYIHADPDVLLGKPVIKGTRLSVELILELYGSGWTEQMLLDSYPILTRDSLRAVFHYVQDCLRHELYFPISAAA